MKFSKIFLLCGLFLLIEAPNLVFCQHKLTLQLKNMLPHVGQKFQAIVVDKANQQQVGRTTVPSIPSSDFNVDLYVIITGHSYRIDFFADFNNNGHYDPPPADHAWRLEADNVQSDTTLIFTHNTNFTDIQYPPLLNPAHYQGKWTGTWKNLTFNTTGPITTVINIDTTNKTVQLTITTTGAFGIPDTVTYILNGSITADGDSAYLSAPATWSGTVVISPGQISGSVTVPAFGVNITLTGNFGPSQSIFSYTMSGSFNANGIILLTKEKETVVDRTYPIKQPEQFALYQNYPNPFNPVTTIPFSIKKPSWVVIKVYDILGKDIVKIVDENLPAGNYKIPFNATGIPSGIYFFSIHTENFRAVRKMTLIE